MSSRIVVADDESHITRAINMKLSRAGFDIETASDGQAAWEAIEREVPAMLITDCQMPRLDGLGLCRRVRADEATKDLPILLLTAKGFELDEGEMKAEYGITKIVVKPFSPRELLKIVHETLGVTEAANETAVKRGQTPEIM